MAGDSLVLGDVFALMGTAVIIADADTRILGCNPAAEALLGRSAKGLAGELLEAVFPECGDWLRHLKKRGAAMTAPAVSLGSVRRMLPGGFQESLRSRAVLTPLQEETAGFPAGAAVMLELTPVEDTLRQDRENATTGLMQANRQLLRNLAHEIKNPLGGIRGAAQLLEGDLTRPEDRECTGIIIEEADRLQTLVDRFLAPYRKSDNEEPVDLVDVLEYVRSLITLEYPSVRFVRDYDISAPAVRGDRDRFTQVFLNLVRNAAEALEGTPPEGDPVITLRTRIVRDVMLGGAERVRMALAADVIDNGPGVPPEMQEKIFYPLVTGRAQGSGLGLSLAQTFVSRAGGTIGLESVPGRTVFRVMLPLA